MHADAFENIDNGHVAALELAGQNGAAVHKHGSHVEAQHRHHDTGQALVAAGNADKGVVGVTAHRQFNRVGDDFARDQRRLHALMAHRNAVGDGDGAELTRRTAGIVNTGLGRLGLPHQGNVTRRGFVPARHHADERPVNLLFRQPHRIVVRSMRGT